MTTTHSLARHHLAKASVRTTWTIPTGLFLCKPPQQGIIDGFWCYWSQLADRTSTLTTTFTTDVDTMTEYTRVTPSSTLTELITAAGEVKRNANAQITARAVLNRHEAFQLYRRQTNNTDDDNAMESAFSSACDCHDYQGPVVSSTYTDQTTVRLELGLARLQC